MDFRRPAVLIWVFVVYTAIGVFFALHYYLDDVTWHHTGTLGVRFLEEMCGAYSGMVLLPFMSWLTQRFPFTPNNRVRAFAAVAGGLVVYTLAHTTINAAMRYGLAPLFGIHYDYGQMILRYPMEAAGDTVYYGIIMASLYLINHFVATHDLEAKLSEAKLENLRLQLHPHFLFNTLNAISSVMYEDVAKADAMLSKLSDFLRTVLDSGTVHTVSLDEELAVERMYVDIMTTRLERKLTLNVAVDDDAKDSTVPFMLLQPLLENSIRHGMGSSRATLDVAIGVSRANGRTVIRVDDDGLGIDSGAIRGIGLNNVASRLSYMYGEDATFSIAPLPQGGTRATLAYPYARGERPCR